MRRSIVVLLTCLSLAGVGAAAYLVGASTASAPPPANLAVPQASPSPQNQPASTAEIAAVLWLEATNTRSWEDPAADAWVQRALPLTTEAEADAVRSGHQAHDAEWAGYVAAQCSTRVLRPDSVIPAEAPSGADLAYVSVSGEVTTTCPADRESAYESATAVTATVKVRRGAEGWRVAEQVF